MKKKIFITVALIAFTSITNQVVAQETIAKTRTKSNNTNEKVVEGKHIAVAVLVQQTDTGISINFESSIPSSGTASGKSSKKGYDYYKAQSFSVSAADNSVSEVVSPRDAASGLPTGKRTHKPVSSSTTSSGNSAEAISPDGSGRTRGRANVQDISMSKVNVQDLSVSKATFKEFTITKRCAGKTTKISCESGDCEIPTGDCPNGDCAVTAEWSWGASQSGSSNRCSVDFLFEIEDGACTSMAINEKGLPVEKKIKKTNTPK